MEDKIIKVLTENKEVRCFIARTTNIVNLIKEVHNTSKTATAALGRLLTANVIMASDLKNSDDTVSLQIRTNGLAGSIITYANGNCEVKGYIKNPDADLPIREDGKIDVGGLVGLDGELTVVKDIGLKEPYTGTINLISGEIAEDITYYFAKSEQIPTVVALGVLVDKDNRIVVSSGGMMIQLLPEASEETIEKLEGVFNNGFSISKMLTEDNPFDSILNAVFKDMKYEITDEICPALKCDCSKERFLRGIVSLGREEIEKLIENNENITANCHFCNKSYEYTVDEIKDIIR